MGEHFSQGYLHCTRQENSPYAVTELCYLFCTKSSTYLTLITIYLDTKACHIGHHGYEMQNLAYQHGQESMCCASVHYNYSVRLIFWCYDGLKLLKEHMQQIITLPLMI